MQRLILSLNSVNLVLIMSESSSIRWNMTSFIEQLEENVNRWMALYVDKNIKPNPTPKDIMQALHFIGDKSRCYNCSRRRKCY